MSKVTRHTVKCVKSASRKQTLGLDLRTRIKPSKKVYKRGRDKKIQKEDL